MQLLSQCAIMAMTIMMAVAADILTPRVMIVSMFAPEAQAWYDNFHLSGLGNLSAITVPVRGLSMLFPSIACTLSGDICQVTIGEGEINAAASMTALILSTAFDLRKTYFFLGGIAGANPNRATLGSVAFARYAVQVGLQYEVDPRSLPDDWDTGYVAYGSDAPHQYPSIVYGTEVFELNARLRDAAYELAMAAELADDEHARTLRLRYDPDTPAAQAPSILKCDVTTSDVYFVGDRLARTFEKTVDVWTNGTGEYCMSAQEDNAVLEALVRGAVHQLVDFSKIILMRTGSNIDRPPPNMPIRDFIATTQPGQAIATKNMYNAGIRVIHGILEAWDHMFVSGIHTDNYVGDILGSLGGTPDFGTPQTRLQAQRADIQKLQQQHQQQQKHTPEYETINGNVVTPTSTNPMPTQRQARQKKRSWQERRVANAKTT